MCGIVGVIGNGVLAADLKIYKQLLIADTFRGAHSTGQFVVGASAPFSYFKRAVPGWDFLEHKTADRMVTVNQRAMIGHNRYATTGAINNINAHPFATDNIVGVHNGSLWDTSGLKDDHLYDVDSEALFNDIDANGIEHTARVADGAFALVWYDARDRMLRLVRNEQRPLAMYLHPNRDVAYIASEADMLRWIIRRNDTHNFDDGLLMDIEAGDLWTFDMSRAARLTESATTDKIEVSNTYKPVKQTYSYGENYGVGWGSHKKSGPKVYNSRGAVNGNRVPKKYAELCDEYKVQDNQKIVADFTHLSQNTGMKTRSYNLSGKVLWPETMAGLTVNCYGVPEHLGGAGIFESTLQSMYETEDNEVRLVLKNNVLSYLGDDKEVLLFSKKSVTVKA